MTKQDVAFIVILLLAIFLFQGEPDVWDKLHENVMHSLEVK